MGFKTCGGTGRAFGFYLKCAGCVQFYPYTHLYVSGGGVAVAVIPSSHRVCIWQAWASQSSFFFSSRQAALVYAWMSRGFSLQFSFLLSPACCCVFVHRRPSCRLLLLLEVVVEVRDHDVFVTRSDLCLELGNPHDYSLSLGNIFELQPRLPHFLCTHSLCMQFKKCTQEPEEDSHHPGNETWKMFSCLIQLHPSLSYFCAFIPVFSHFILQVLWILSGLSDRAAGRLHCYNRHSTAMGMSVWWLPAIHW